MSQGDKAPRTEIQPRSAAEAAVPAADSYLQRVVTAVTVIVIAGLLIALCILGIDILLAAFGGILIAVFLNAFAAPLQRHTPLSYGWSLAAVILGMLLITAAGSALLLPRIAEQIDQLTQQLPGVTKEIESLLQQYGWGLWILDKARNGTVLQAAPGAGEGFTMLSQWSSYILVAVFVGLFAAAHPKLYQDGMVNLFPPRHRPRVRKLVNELGCALRWWLIGQGLAMILIGVSTAIMLWLFGIPLAIVLGVIVGLLGFIPYLGPILGAVPVALIAATGGPIQVVYVMLAYSAVQTLEGYVATPLIQHQTVYLPPAFTIVAQLLLGSVVGLLGFVLATPLAAAVLVLARFYRTEILGDQDVGKGPCK